MGLDCLFSKKTHLEIISEKIKNNGLRIAYTPPDTPTMRVCTLDGVWANGYWMMFWRRYLLLIIKDLRAGER